MKKKARKFYKNNRGQEFTVGSIVMLADGAFRLPDNLLKTDSTFAGKPYHKARIVSISSDKSGMVFVHPKLGGYHSWNVNDLRKVPNA